MQSLCLYDDGEENWQAKLHLGSGGISLQGYTNIDIRGVLGDEYPQARQDNLTTIDCYYDRLNGSMAQLPRPRSTVVDLLCDIRKLPYHPATIDKIVAIQVFEHLTPVEGFRALWHWHNILKPGAPLILSVPDMLGTIALLESSSLPDSLFAIRHLRGSYKNEYARHFAWYTEATLTELLEHTGFVVERLPNIHLYPAIILKGRRLRD